MLVRVGCIDARFDVIRETVGVRVVGLVLDTEPDAEVGGIVLETISFAELVLAEPTPHPIVLIPASNPRLSVPLIPVAPRPPSRPASTLAPYAPSAACTALLTAASEIVYRVPAHAVWMVRKGVVNSWG